MVLLGLPIFQQSVDSELYEWLIREQKRRGARTVQDVIRQILREAKAEAETWPCWVYHKTGEIETKTLIDFYLFLEDLTTSVINERPLLYILPDL